ncbi:MAG: diaminopimelate epimerase [Bdellovibrionales bacterium]|nr:diaminopimelate epimerase [Bdellovibrionales bacterium]
MEKISSLTFSKLSAARNDFLIVDLTEDKFLLAWHHELGKWSRLEIAKKLCDRTGGIGADGLLLVTSGGDSFDYEWDFYNSDGSQAEMCGNLARCAHLWARAKKPQASSFVFSTPAGRISTREVEDHLICVDMPPVIIKDLKKEISLDSGVAVSVAVVNTGVPHAVVVVSSLNLNELKPLALKIRRHGFFSPQGTNVTFVVQKNASTDAKSLSLTVPEMDVVTFERGVEDFTQACGTGAVAAGLWSFKHSGAAKTIIHMPGGDLQTLFDESGHACLIGPAYWVADCQIHLHSKGVLFS